MKKVILLVLILNFQFSILNSLRAQGFEWVRTYTGAEVSNTDDPTNRIIGSCVDSAGNLYILGEFSPQAQLCGERLLPFEVITTPLNRAVVIAKLSSSGELLWHKSIYNGKYSCFAYALRMIGDSSIMAMVALRLPYNYGGNLYLNLYYLDTLLTGNDDYLMLTDSVSSNSYNAFITFDLNGNVTEQHFICVGFKDSNGNALTDRYRIGIEYPDKLSAIPLSDRNFNIDSEGNIYVVRSVHTDRMVGVVPHDTTWSIADGNIGAMEIVVDGTHKLTYPVPYATAMWNQQILKFSPHFDSLIDAVYMFDSILYRHLGGTIKVNSFDIDAQNNLYLAMLGGQVPAHLRIANSNSLCLGDSLRSSTWIIKYNMNLYATDLIQLSYTGTGSFPLIDVCASYADDNTNSLFVSGAVSWLENYTTIDNIFYKDDTLDLPDWSGFWLRLDKDNLNVLSMGRALPGVDGQVNVFPKLEMNNNRVFSEIGFRWSTIFGDTTIYANQPSDHDRAFAIWDYDGNEISIMKHGFSNLGNILHAPQVIDSIVYLTGSIWEDATFGDITTQNYGSSQVFIAKYVDPEFAQPYVHPSDRQGQSIEWQQDLVFTLADSPVTLTATATSGLPVSYTSSDSTIAYVEGDRLHLVADGHAWLTATQEGNYQYFPAEPVQRLLTVGNVGIATVGADGQAKAYPNPTSGRVTIDLAKIPPAPPLPSKGSPQRDTGDVDVVLYTAPGSPFTHFETYPNPFRQRYNVRIENGELGIENGTVAAWLTDMQGRREEVALTPAGENRYTLDLTNRPSTAYLLTVTTADGQQITLRLMKQSEVFGH